MEIERLGGGATWAERNAAFWICDKTRAPIEALPASYDSACSSVLPILAYTLLTLVGGGATGLTGGLASVKAIPFVFEAAAPALTLVIAHPIRF